MASSACMTARAALAGGARAVPAPVSGRRTAAKGGARSRVQRISAISTPRKPNSGVAGMARPDDNGRFGKFGGRYVPETLIYALDELVVAYKQAKEDPEYQVRGPSPQPGVARLTGVRCEVLGATTCELHGRRSVRASSAPSASVPWRAA